MNWAEDRCYLNGVSRVARRSVWILSSSLFAAVAITLLSFDSLFAGPPTELRNLIQGPNELKLCMMESEFLAAHSKRFMESIQHGPQWAREIVRREESPTLGIVSTIVSFEEKRLVEIQKRFMLPNASSERLRQIYAEVKREILSMYAIHPKGPIFSYESELPSAMSTLLIDRAGNRLVVEFFQIDGLVRVAYFARGYKGRSFTGTQYIEASGATAARLLLGRSPSLCEPIALRDSGP